MALHPGEQGHCPAHGPFVEFCDGCADAKRKQRPHTQYDYRATPRKPHPSDEGTDFAISISASDRRRADTQFGRYFKDFIRIA